MYAINVFGFILFILFWCTLPLRSIALIKPFWLHEKCIIIRKYSLDKIESILCNTLARTHKTTKLSVLLLIGARPIFFIHFFLLFFLLTFIWWLLKRVNRFQLSFISFLFLQCAWLFSLRFFGLFCAFNRFHSVLLSFQIEFYAMRVVLIDVPLKMKSTKCIQNIALRCRCCEK